MILNSLSFNRHTHSNVERVILFEKKEVMKGIKAHLVQQMIVFPVKVENNTIFQHGCWHVDHNLLPHSNIIFLLFPRIHAQTESTAVGAG